MAGLVPASHALPCGTKNVDARDKPGHDGSLIWINVADVVCFSISAILIRGAQRTTTMKINLSLVALLAMIVSGSAQAAALSDAETRFLDQLVTASVVLEQRCDGYEVDGAGAVQLGARLLGSTEAAMAIIDAYAAAIKARDGESYDPAKFRAEVSEAAGKTFRQVRTDLIRRPKGACADYGDSSVDHGLLRRY
jgi:hypothetical protein